MAPKAESIHLMRVVVREDFTRDRCDLLLRDLLKVVRALKEQSQETVRAMKELPYSKSRWHWTTVLGKWTSRAFCTEPPVSNMRGVC